MTNTDKELKTGYIKVKLDYAPRDNDKAFREWCKAHNFDCFGLDNGREAWCSSLGTYLRGADGVAYADGEPFLFYEEDLVDLDRLINQARVDTVNWAVHYVDKIERENPAPDDMWRTFKFIRNGMREEFERAYGVDPAPSYDPSKAKLTSLKGEVDG